MPCFLSDSIQLSFSKIISVAKIADKIIFDNSHIKIRHSEKSGLQYYFFRKYVVVLEFAFTMYLVNVCTSLMMQICHFPLEKELLLVTIKKHFLFFVATFSRPNKLVNSNLHL